MTVRNNNILMSNKKAVDVGMIADVAGDGRGLLEFDVRENV